MADNRLEVKITVDSSEARAGAAAAKAAFDGARVSAEQFQKALRRTGGNTHPAALGRAFDDMARASSGAASNVTSNLGSIAGAASDTRDAISAIGSALAEVGQKAASSHVKSTLLTAGGAPITERGSSLASAIVTQATVEQAASRIAQVRTLGERAAHGISTAMDAAFVPPALLGNVERAFRKEQQLGARAAHGIQIAFDTAFASPGALAGAEKGIVALKAAASESAAGIVGGAEAAASGMGHLKLATAGTTREFIVLGHEALTGRFSRIPGSIMVLMERMGSLHSVVGMLASGWGIAGVAGAAFAASLGYIAYQAYEAQQALDHIRGGLVLTGRGNEMGAGQDDLGKWVDSLHEKYDIAKSDARKVVAAFADVRTMTLRQAQAVSEAAVAYAKLRGEDADKVADAWAKAFQSGSKGAEKLAQALNLPTEKIEQMARSKNELGAIAEAVNEITDAVHKSGGAWVEAWKKFSDYQSAVAASAVGEGVMPNFDAFGPPPPMPPRDVTAGTNFSGPEGDAAQRVRNAGSQADAVIDFALRSQGQKLHNMCAALVNSALESAGLPTSGSNLASSFKTYGQSVAAGSVGKGDIFYAGPSGEGDTGHVGITMGPVVNGRVQVMSSHMQGPNSNPAGVEWRNAADLQFRRPSYSAAPAGDQVERETPEQRAAHEAEYRNARDVYRVSQGENRHNLGQQVEDAKAYYETVKRLRSEDSDEARQAGIHMRQLENRLYDENTNKLVGSLREKQNLSRQTDEKIAEQQKIIGTLKDRGLGDTTEMRSAQERLATLQKEKYDQDTQNFVSALRAKQEAARDIGAKIAAQLSIIGTLQSRGMQGTPEMRSAEQRLESLKREQTDRSLSSGTQSAERQIQIDNYSYQTYVRHNQARVASRQMSDQQALALDMNYLDELHRQETQSLQDLMASDQRTETEKKALYIRLLALHQQYEERKAQLEQKAAQEAEKANEKYAAGVKQAFDGVGSAIERAFNGLVTGQMTRANALKQLWQGVTSSVLSGIESIASKAAAGPLARLLGTTAKPGEGVGDVLGGWASNQIGSMLGSTVSGATSGVEIGAAMTTGGATAAAAIGAAMTTAGAAAAASIGAAMAAGGAASAGASAAGSVVGGAASAAGAASAGGSVLGWIGRGLMSLIPFSEGGIVPAAAGGWSLPSSFGTDRVMAALTPGEMVLPRHLSDGVRQMVGGAGAPAGDVHLHIAPGGMIMDGPSFQRWFIGRAGGRQLITEAVRGAFRSNALTPRTI
jgi:Prophage tail length tape measure protein